MTTPRFPLILLTRRRLERLILAAKAEGYDIGYQFAKETFQPVPKRMNPPAGPDKEYEGIGCHGQCAPAPALPATKKKVKPKKKDRT